MSRRRRLSKSIFDNYLSEDDEIKLQCQDMVFEYYFEAHEHLIEAALEQIRLDLQIFEENEQYERCAMLKDILKKFE